MVRALGVVGLRPFRFFGTNARPSADKVGFLDLDADESDMTITELESLEIVIGVREVKGGASEGMEMTSSESRIGLRILGPNLCIFGAFGEGRGDDRGLEAINDKPEGGGEDGGRDGEEGIESELRRGK